MDFLRPEIKKIADEKFKKDDFDGAIFESCLYLEAKLQEIGETKTINTKLVKEVFDNKKLIVSEDKDRNIGAMNFFDFIFRLLRNDRGHNKTLNKKIEIPCNGKEDCLKYLSVISLALQYIQRNFANKPFIESYSVNNNFELKGGHFNDTTKVFVNNIEVAPISVQSERILITIPEKTEGEVYVKNELLESDVLSYSLPAGKPKNATYEVVAVNIDLYSDKDLKNKNTDYVGVKYVTHEISGRQYIGISPTNKIYKVGDYIDFGQFDHSKTCSETWYKDPLNQNIIRSAWTGSAVLIGDTIGHKGKLTERSISITPSIIKMVKDDKILVRAVLHKGDGVLPVEEDVSENSDCKWSIINEDIAHIDVNGFLRSKKLGSATIECKYKSFHCTAKVEVFSQTSGTKIKYFANNLNHLQQLVVDSKDNIYLTNQSNIVWRIGMEADKTGKLEKVIELPCFDDPVYGLHDNPPMIDCISIDKDDNLYINSHAPRAIYKFDIASFKSTTLKQSTRPLKSIAVDSKGIAYVGNMENELIKIYPDGREEILKIEIHSIGLALLDDDRIAVVSAGGGNNIDLYSTSDGVRISRISTPDISSPTDIACHNNKAYVACFHGGDIYELDFNTKSHKKIVGDLFTAGGLAFDNEGNILYSCFDASDPSNICIWKIYL